jgi:hypothetical protein
MSEEDDVVEMTENEEMRFSGLTGDDEDDLFGDAEELLRRDLFDGSAVHPHPLDDDMAPIEFHAAAATPVMLRAMLVLLTPTPMLLMPPVAGVNALLPHHAGRILRSSSRR